MNNSEINELSLLEIDDIFGGGFWADVGDFFSGLLDGFSDGAAHGANNN